MRIASRRAWVLVPLICGFSALWADSGSGTFFFTTFSPQPGVGAQSGSNFNVWSDTFTYTATDGTAPGTFTLGTYKGMALLAGADGILIAPDGNLLVGGQNGT